MFINILLPVLFLIIILFLFFKRFKKKAATESYDLTNYSILEVQVPRDMSAEDTQFSSLASEHFFASLHGLLEESLVNQEHFSFEIAADALGIHFYIAAQENTLKFIESQVYAQYPKAQLKIVPDYVNLDMLAHMNYDAGTLRFDKDYFFPLKIFRDFEIDPLANILSPLADVKENEGMWLQYIVKPKADGWQKDGHAYVNAINKGESLSGEDNFFWSMLKGIVGELATILIRLPAGFFSTAEAAQASAKAPATPTPVKLTTFQELEVKLIENKLAKMGFEVVVRVVGYANDQNRLDHNIRTVTASFKQFSNTSTNSLSLAYASDKQKEIQEFQQRTFDTEKALILNNEELATLYHLPDSRQSAPSVSWVYSKLGEPPSTLPTQNATLIGETLYRGKKVRFGLDNGDDRLRHMYLIGKTGTGKSTLLETMITQDIANGNGVGVLDPHGETIDKVLDRIPDNRIDDVIIFDPSDHERPVGINLLEMDSPDQKNLMASALVSAIHQHFDYSWGPRLEYLLNYTVLTLLEVQGTSMLGITRLLEDDNYRKYILHQVKDPVVQRFWETEYKNMKGNQKLVTEAIAPIQNKINRFLASTTIRNILGQRNSTIDLWDVMQSKKILLMNLSKGKIGSDNANLLGALLVSRLQFMALQRAKIPYDQRVPFYLYVDEFQNFATGSFEEILSESRKYKLGLYMTHQYTSQLPEEILKAVFGNVGTIATFSLGAPDAKVLANEFAPYFDDEDIISLERFNIYIKMMINGMTSLPFSARILLPWLPETSIVPVTNNREKVIERSRQKYGTDRAYVEDLIARWIERPFDKGMAIAEEHREKKND